MLKIQKTHITGCLLIEPEVYQDHRGRFMEVYNQKALEEALGIPLRFVQDNQSVSKKYVLRGLHFQRGPHAQGKLVHVACGRALDVVVDLRRESPSFGKHYSVELSGTNNRVLYIPKGLAHGFLSLEDQTVFKYKCDAYYHPAAEGGIRYDDPDLNIDWGITPEKLILSEKDLNLPGFKEACL